MATLTNLATNPQPKLNGDGWSSSGNGATTTWTRFSSGFAGSTDAFLELGWSTVTGGSDGHVRYTQPVTPGDRFSAALEVIPSRAQVFTPLIVFVDASNNILQSAYGVDVSVDAGAVARLGVGGLTVPAGAAQAWVSGATSLDKGTPWQVGDKLKTSRVIVSNSLSVPPYFDGSYPQSLWLGTAFASASTFLVSTAPTVTPLPDWSPVPRMSVLFASLHPFAETITVERTVGNKRFRVRGAIDRYAVGGFGVLDTEAPKGVPSTYRAEQFDGSGLSLGYTDSATATLDFEGSCIHQPLDPKRNVAYRFVQGAAADLVKPTPGEIFYPEGRGEAVWIGSQRRGLQGVNLDGATLTLEDAAKLDSMFGTPDEPQTPILCIRTAGMDLPPTLFAVVEEPHQMGFDRFQGGETIRWQMQGTQVAPPAPGLIVPLLTYADLDAAFATYAERDAHYASYFEQDTDWSLAGLAG